jgi:dGTPase
MAEPTGAPVQHALPGDAPALAPGLEPYAACSSRSRGRVHAEPPPTGRDEFQRDRDRIIHSAAFRRLQYKTQVFLHHEGNHFRTRLTHTLEVSQMARSMARALRLDEDLAEAVALAHDLGHTPFGHAGERVLHEKMAEWGGFDHNVQTFRVVAKLEHRYPDFEGLNLTWETLEGVIKHNGPVTDRLSRPSWSMVRQFDANYDLKLATWASAEAQPPSSRL